jgi:hypothetical protein
VEEAGVCSVLMPEWLSGMTRNHVGFARAGSNPAEHGLQFLTAASLFALLFVYSISWSTMQPSTKDAEEYQYQRFLFQLF